MPDKAKIFGYDWKDIDAMQRKRYSRRVVDTSKPSKPPATDADRELLAQYGSLDALRDAGLHGVVDRLEND